MALHNKLYPWVILGCLIPLFWLAVDIATNNLGANPVEALHIRLGDWTLRILWLTLAITPMQTLTKWRGLGDYRQLLGLSAFFYATLHVLTYVLIDHGLMWLAIGTDIIESPYIWFGLLAYIILLALAMTSSKFAKKKLGKNWKKLHRLIYIAAAGSMLHYFMQLKGNLAEPFFYLLLIVFLLSFRLLGWLRPKLRNWAGRYPKQNQDV